jgi:hypothetical protein
VLVAALGAAPEGAGVVVAVVGVGDSAGALAIVGVAPVEVEGDWDVPPDEAGAPPEPALEAPAELRDAAAVCARVPGTVPLPAWLDVGQTADCWGRLSSWVRVPSCGLAWTTWASTPRAEQETMNAPWRTGPCASEVSKIEVPLWLAHDSQNR